MVNASGGALGVTLVVSVLLALNGASGAFGAAGRALNVVYGVEEGRGMVRRKLTDLATALVVIVLFAVVLAAVFLGGQIADDLFGKIGLGSTAATSGRTRAGRWRSSRRRSPTGSSTASRPTSSRAGSAGSRRAPSSAWCCGSSLSIGFAIYMRNFSSYGAAYGAFAAAIVLLLWLYLSANAFLFGAELNAELERAARRRPSAPARGRSSSGG